eukprot:5652166-Prymnesium_polylepis.1
MSGMSACHLAIETRTSNPGAARALQRLALGAAVILECAFDGCDRREHDARTTVEELRVRRVDEGARDVVVAPCTPAGVTRRKAAAGAPVLEVVEGVNEHLRSEDDTLRVVQQSLRPLARQL